MNLHTVNILSKDHLSFVMCVEGKGLISAWLDRSSRFKIEITDHDHFFAFRCPFLHHHFNVSVVLLWCSVAPTSA